jgi:hypothetical protein
MQEKRHYEKPKVIPRGKVKEVTLSCTNAHECGHGYYHAQKFCVFGTTRT